MQISHEAIHLSLYDPRRRQAIDRSLTQRLRSGRPMRHPKIARRPTERGIIRGMVSITARPAEVEDRKIPGHLEGDLVMGRAASNGRGGLEQETAVKAFLEGDIDRLSANHAPHFAPLIEPPLSIIGVEALVVDLLIWLQRP